MTTSRVNYQFSNLCGTVYRQGNLVYSPDGNSLYSAVGNRVACFDLVKARSFTFPFEARRNIAHLALSPDGAVLLTVDDELSSAQTLSEASQSPEKPTGHRVAARTPMIMPGAAAVSGASSATSSVGLLQ